MPPESIWLQFTIVAIVILAMTVIWREMKKFIDEQDKKRDEEREKQRVWQAEQETLRDQRWHEFLKAMQEEWMAQNGVNTKAVQDLIKRVDEMLRRMDEHDRFTRDAIIAMHERTNKA